MRIDRDAYYEYFTKHDIPSWNCSTCNRGKVNLIIEDVIVTETNDSVKDREEDDWEPSWVKQHFICKINCNNPKCKEGYSIAGETSVADDYDEKNGIFFTECYYPKFIFPTLKLFDFPEETPYDIEDALLHSFKLYWFDHSACANAIRSTIEIILTDKKIAKTELLKSKKRKSLPLHRRIEIFEAKNAEVSNYLMGNHWRYINGFQRMLWL